MEPATVPDQMARMITGYWTTQMICAAAKLGIADRLAEGSRTSEQLADETGSHARTLYRLLRALASVGIFSEGEGGRFSQTPLSESLRRDAPGSQWAMAVIMGEEHYQAWGDLYETVRTGQTAFDRLYGRPIFQYLGEHPEKAPVFDAAMTAIHGRETQSTLDAYDFSDIPVLADIGGGNGTNLIGILGRYPRMRGTLFDLPHVVERAHQNLDRAGMSDRCRVVGGDFFESIPGGADAYLLRHVIHDWDDEKSTAILRSIHRAAGDHLRLLLVECVVPSGNEPAFGKLMDLNMLLVPGGVERTALEYRRLFESAGFHLTRIVPTADVVSVIEGRKQ